MLQNLSGHNLNQTGTLLEDAIVAITRGKNFIPPTFSTVASRHIPSPSTASPTAILPRTTAPIDLASPLQPSMIPSLAAPSSADPTDVLSKKVSLQMQKEELIRAGYEKDYINSCDEERIAYLVAKDNQEVLQQTPIE